MPKKGPKGRKAAHVSGPLPKVFTPTVDPPTLRVAPRQKVRAYITTPANIPSDGRMVYNVSDIIADLKVASNRNISHFIVLSVQCWGAAGIQGGATVNSRLRISDNPTYVDAEDRGSIQDRPRVGLSYPPTAQKVHKADDDYNLFTVSAYADSAEEAWKGVDVLVTALVWD